MIWKTGWRREGVWHRWFAWYPVQVGGEWTATRRVNTWAWLQWVEFCQYGSYGGKETVYRLPQEEEGE